MIRRFIFALLLTFVFALPASAITLRWNAPINGGTVDGYRVYVDRAEVATIAGDTTEYDLGTPVEGETHIYGVTAFNSAGQSQPAELQFTYEPSQTIVFPNRPQTLTLIFNESAAE